MLTYLIIWSIYLCLGTVISSGSACLIDTIPWLSFWTTNTIRYIISISTLCTLSTIIYFLTISISISCYHRSNVQTFPYIINIFRIHLSYITTSSSIQILTISTFYTMIEVIHPQTVTESLFISCEVLAFSIILIPLFSLCTTMTETEVVVVLTL